MNFEEIKKMREEKMEKDTNDMINAINANHERAYDKWLLEQQVAKIRREKQDKREIRYNIISIVMIIIMLIMMTIMLVFAFKDYNETADACDNARGKICTTYEIRQYAIRGE